MSTIPDKPANPTLAARIERAAAMAYVDGAKDAVIAKALGVKPATIPDWRKRPEWQAAVNRLRDEQARQASDRLSLMTDKAVTAVERSLESGNPTVRLKAATWVLERASLTPSTDMPSEFELYVRSSHYDGD